ncbi:MAG: MBL fold metallo-hydrolase RNA specificity domain-containing protein, partial [Eisenbergiella sp.]
YQAGGTPGRSLVEGIKEMRLFGETVDVNAHIMTLAGMSGHADKNGLINWINGFTRKPDKVFIVHGEDQVTMSFADCLKDEYGFDAYAPYSGTIFDLAAGELEVTGEPVVRKKKTADTAVAPTGVYGRLVAAGQRLLNIIKRCEGRANKDLAKFADQINSLCDKWN